MPLDVAENREQAQPSSRVAQLEYEALLHRRRCRELQAQLHASTHAQGARSLSGEARGALDALLSGKAKLGDVLEVVALTYSDRVVVLDSAWRSAQASEDFRYPDIALSLLRHLATTYWQALVDGNGDVRARRVFPPKEYSSGESETVETNRRARRLRTFSYRQSEVVINTHLRHGIKDSAAETLRIHFHWDPDDERVVIGHCGRHLDHA